MENKFSDGGINMSLSLFIALEGGDYSGKKEQSKRLHNYFLDRSEDNIVITLHQPTHFAKEIKRKLAEDKDAYADAEKMAELYVEDREYISKKLIVPALKMGSIVISNRHKMSTCNYQRIQGMDLERLLKMHHEVGIPSPDINLVLDISDEEAERRMNNLSHLPDKFEMHREFREKVYTGYRELAAMAKNDRDLFGYVEIVNGNNPPEKVFEDIKKFVDPLYEKLVHFTLPSQSL